MGLEKNCAISRLMFLFLSDDRFLNVKLQVPEFWCNRSLTGMIVISVKTCSYVIDAGGNHEIFMLHDCIVLMPILCANFKPSLTLKRSL